MTTFLESDRLWYRAPEPEDTPRLARWINDLRVRRTLDHHVFPKSQEAEKQWIERQNPLNIPQVNDHVVLLFGVKGSAEPIGNAGFHGIDWVGRSAEWGILIGEEAEWNKGYAREVARRMLRYAFEELNLRRVQLRAAAGNAAGIKAYEAAGFVHEGTLRQAMRVDGAYVDVRVMSVLREDWANQQCEP